MSLQRCNHQKDSSLYEFECNKHKSTSSWCRTRMFLFLGVVFASAIHSCESFNPPSSPRNNKEPTVLGVVETKSKNPPEPIVGPFPSANEDVLGSMYSRAVPRFEGSSAVPEDDNVSETDTQETTANQRNDSDTEDYDDKAADDEMSERLARTAMAADLLSRRRSVASRSSVRQKATSVGPRRVGAAGRSRQKGSSMTKLVDAVRQGAVKHGPEKPSNKPSNKPSARPNEGNSETNASTSLNLTKEAVHNTVRGMIGVLGNPETIQASEKRQFLRPGTLLLSPGQQTTPWNPADRVSVRVATESDDTDIANLRLSVFSNFSTEMRKAFVSRSCHVLSSRRNRGAACIVATVPRYGSILSSKPDIILGSAECSYHEFFGTELGKRRLKDSILYITEVAVSPTSRGKGIGRKLMQALDQLAEKRGAETVFLHVDVNNAIALSLYEKCGYRRVPSQDNVFYEFTKSLNLHDGATKGRNHFLMYKNLKQATWLPVETRQDEPQRSQLGFEIPC